MEDGLEDYGDGGNGDMNGERQGGEDGTGGAPMRAAVMAQVNESSRATLQRAMLTVLHMAEVRGFTHVTEVYGHLLGGAQKVLQPTMDSKPGNRSTKKRKAGGTHDGTAPAPSALHGEHDTQPKPNNLKEALELIRSVFFNPETAESIAEAAEQKGDVVMKVEVGDDVPRFSLAHTCELARGTSMQVVVCAAGVIQPVRTAVQNCVDAAFVVLLSPCKLKAYSDKWCRTQTKPVIHSFPYEDVQKSLAKHSLHKRHNLLTPEQVAVAMAKYPGGKSQELLINDAAVKFYGFKKGHVVHVQETFGRTQPTDTYFEVIG